jgi:probable rRNA maturation factor
MITLDIEDEILTKAQSLSQRRYDAIAHAFSVQFPDVDGVIGVSYVSDIEIRRLNRMYRNKDAVTDVLSFASDFVSHTGVLGDVVICFDQAMRQAESGDIELEVVDLMVHGILHVLGYDHEIPPDAAVMFPLQDRLVSLVL